MYAAEALAAVQTQRCIVDGVWVIQLLARVYILMEAGENGAISGNDLVLLKLNSCLQLISSVCIATVQFEECSIMSELGDSKLLCILH